jgi:hypothetical protein
VSDEQLTLIALLGAGAAAGGYALLSHRLSDQIEPPSRWYRLTWPRDLEPDAVVAFFRNVAGDRRRHVIALETVGSDGHLSYRLGVAERHAESILASLRSYLPGVAGELIEHDIVRAPVAAWRLRITTSQRALRTDSLEHVARALVTALANASARDTVVFQWLLGPRLVPLNVANSHRNAPASTWPESLRQVVSGVAELDSDERHALREKTREPGFRAVCRVGIAAAKPQAAKVVASMILGALRAAEAPGVRIDLKPENPGRISEARVLKDWPTPLNVRELAGLTGWPLGDKPYPGVTRIGARLLKPSESIPRKGRIIAQSTYPGDERPLALEPRDALQHLHVLGPTGVGKSTLLLNLIIQDIAAGRGVIVIDPKGDLVEDVLARIPDKRVDDVVVLDPADEQRPVGLNVLRGGERSSELIADQVLAVFHGLYESSWGPRTQDILHSSLLTLAGRPDTTLCALPVLLSNPRFRREATKGLTDEIALKPFWIWYEGLSDGERHQAIAPVMNKLRAFLLRPRMRAVVGQANPLFDMRDVFTKRKVLLVSLAKGLLGPEAAALLGSLAVSQLWHTTLGRVRLPLEKRTPVMVYIDEFQDYLNLPTDLADVLAQARSLGVGLTLAHQHIAQLPSSVRSAVLANARSRVCFQLAHDDAKLVAATSGELDALDLQGLGRYESYVSLVADGNVTLFASARTLAPSPPSANPTDIRARSREQYGRDIAAVEAELTTLVMGGETDDDHPIGRRRRS